MTPKESNGERAVGRVVLTALRDPRVWVIVALSATGGNALGMFGSNADLDKRVAVNENTIARQQTQLDRIEQKIDRIIERQAK